MIRANEPADPVIHFEAIKLARACRRVIQSCLREEEWSDCDSAFYLIIRESLEAMKCAVPKR